jgi:hypothetical protein
MARPSLALVPLVALLAVVSACNKAPAEPDAPPAPSVTTPAVAPLGWDAPAAWTRLDSPPTGPQKAGYRINHTGNDKDDAEVAVLFFGTGSKGDPAPIVKSWLGQFQGDAGANATHDQRDVKGFKLETTEVSGTYKIALTPPTPGHNHPPVQMVKEHFRMIVAVVRTPDRGNWFFKLTGPDETVQAARSALGGLFETLR